MFVILHLMNRLCRVILKAKRKLGESSQPIMRLLRDMDPRYATATLVKPELADCIVGVGIDSDER